MCGVPSVEREAIEEMVKSGRSTRCPFGKGCLGNGKKSSKAMMCQICRKGFGKDGAVAIEYEIALVKEELTKPRRSVRQLASSKKVGHKGRINWLSAREVWREAERIADLIVQARKKFKMDDQELRRRLIEGMESRNNYGPGLVKHILVKANEVLKRREELILAKPAEPFAFVGRTASETGNVAQVVA